MTNGNMSLSPALRIKTEPSDCRYGARDSQHDRPRGGEMKGEDKRQRHGSRGLSQRRNIQMNIDIEKCDSALDSCNVSEVRRWRHYCPQTPDSSGPRHASPAGHPDRQELLPGQTSLSSPGWRLSCRDSHRGLRCSGREDQNPPELPLALDRLFRHHNQPRSDTREGAGHSAAAGRSPRQYQLPEVGPRPQRGPPRPQQSHRGRGGVQ